MLEHQKTILEKVSDNKELFRKEIIKSFKWLKSYEILELHKWLQENFNTTHEEVIKSVFQYIAA